MTPPPTSRPTLLLLATLAALTGCDSQVRFEVTVPPETPAGAVLLLQGSDPAFDGPSGQGLELVHEEGTTFSVKARLPRDEEVSYSLQMTQPDARVELDAAGAVVPARTVRVRKDQETVSLTVERWGPETGDTSPRTVFVVTVPEITPPDADIWLSGNHQELGEWNGAGVKLYKTVDDRYATTLSFAPGTSLEFKVTRGSWSTVEKSAEGEEVENHTHKTGSGFERAPLTVGWWADFGSVPPKQVLTGHIEYLRDVTPTNPTLKKRDVIVWLPPDYATNPTRRYPVLYMHDGQNLMDATTAYAGEWGVDETAQKLVEAGQVEPVIIVGIYNAGTERVAEYTQVPDPRYADIGGERGGKADDYGRFLVEELKPLIDGKYRTKPEARYTGLAGSSLGGLVSLYLGMKYPGTFTRLGVISPSVFWGENDIVTRVNALPAKPPLHLWVDIGTDESSHSQETVDDTRLLRDALVGKGWVLGTDLKYTEVAGGRHREKDWAARFGDILQYLFPAQ